VVREIHHPPAEGDFPFPSARCVCCVSAFLTKDKLRLLKRLMMNLAAAAPARGILLMQPVGEVREAFSTRKFTALDFLKHPDFERNEGGV
jgi:hypothetical protein